MSEEMKPQTEPLKKKVSEKKLRAEEAQGKGVEQTALTPTPPTEGEGILAPIIKRGVPRYFHIVRAFTNSYDRIESELFSAIQKKEEKQIFSADDFCALMFAVAQKLYNDSYSTGRANESNIGRAWREGNKILIDITLKEIIEYGYGITRGTERHRKEQIELIKALHSTPIPFLDSKGTGKGKYLVAVEEWDIDRRKTQGVILRLDEIFCKQIGSYAKFPQDIMKRLVAAAGRSMTSMDRRLLLHLGNQNRNEPHTDKIEFLVQMLGKWEEWKVQKGRVFRQLGDVIERLKAIGVIDGYKLNKKAMTVTFYFKRPKEWSIEDKRSDSSKEGK